MATPAPFPLRFALAALVGILIGGLGMTCAQSRSSQVGGPDVAVAVATPVTGGGPVASSPTPAATGLVAPTVIADVAEQAIQSVVNISATRATPTRGSGRHQPFFDDPFFRDFFRPFEGVPRERRAQSLGSGVIVSPDGVILTNNHVVERAEAIRVTLSDGRELDAEIIGTDSKSDLAVVRLTGDVGALVPLPFGDSDAMRLGEIVLAIGNPFGVGQTVTMGIVSAKGRSRVGIVDYEDFIQTDAAINPGNSGGALVNLRGELIGINTAILSRSGGYQGVGFAIPTDMARPIMESLLRDGEVARGWLGVMIQDVDRDLAEGLGLDSADGILISDVTPDSPAAEAGLERGDVLVSLDGQPISSTPRFRNLIAARGPGASVTLEVLRDGRSRSVQITLGSLADSVAAAGEVEAAEGILYGLTVANLTPELRARHTIPRRIASGVVVTRVAPGSPAQRAGLRVGDAILEVNRQPVDSVRTFERIHRELDRSAVLLALRGGHTIYLTLRR